MLFELYRAMHINTPLIKSFAMSRGTADVWLKMDALQPSGSFKLRGMGHKARREADRGATRFISSSGGNAGLAVAYAGLELDIPVVVYVPASTGQDTIERLRLFGAEVIVSGRHWAEAHAAAMETVERNGGTYFHPFDDEDVWSGHATLVDEVAATGLVPDLVVCSVGGGGLLCGIMRGLERNTLNSAVLAVETEGADSLHQSRVAGAHVELPAITSRAKSLGAVRVCDRAYRYLALSSLGDCVVTDEDAELACERFLTEHRVKVELACGATLAAVYARAHRLVEEASTILVVVCGGVAD